MRIDRRRQILLVTAEGAVLRPTELTASRGTRLAPLSPSGWGAVLNYDALGTWTDGELFGGASLDGWVFSPYGTLASGGIARYTVEPGQNHYLRLGTTYTYTEPDEMRRWRVGDVISGALSWTRAVRLGGVQVASDFALRPDLVTAALPSFSGSVALPSTVDLMVGGIRAFSQNVDPGPFAVRNLPVLTGAGEAVVTVTDALGRQTVTVQPFYASTSLLQPGLASYSLEAGPVRRNFGLVNDTYDSWAAIGTARYGLTDWVTVEGHVEATKDLYLGGIGAALRLGTLGVVNAAMEYSGGRGPYGDLLDGPADGQQVSLSVQRISRRFSVSAGASFASPGFRDVAAAFGTALPRKTVQASLSLPFGDFGTFSLGYVSQRGGTVLSVNANPWGATGGRFSTGAFVQEATAGFSLLTASYSTKVAEGVNFYGTAFADLERGGSQGAMIGVAISLGGGVTASVTASRDGGDDTLRFQAQRTAWSPGDVGFRVMDAEGSFARRFAKPIISAAGGEWPQAWSRARVPYRPGPGCAALPCWQEEACCWPTG